jgi:hypothetical protein
VLENAIQQVYNGERLTLIGHSMGGALWPYMVRWLDSRLNFNNLFRSISFGAPKPSDYEYQYIRRGIEHHAFFNNDDPVPLVPYDPGVFSSYFIFHGLNEMRRLGRFCYRGSGYEIAPTGFFSRANAPGAASANPGASVAAWLSAQVANQETSHSIVSYYSRLQRTTQAPPVQPPISPPILLQAPVPITAMQEAQANRDAIATIVSNGQGRNRDPVVIPDDRLFRAIRVGRLYVVVFGDVEIVNSLNKKRARGIARVGNDWLRRLQRAEIVATENLAGQFSDYLLAASNPTSSFKPTMDDGTDD